MNDLKLAELYIYKEEDARRRGIEFDLPIMSLRNIMRAKRCYFTGVELSDEKGVWNSRTIDRVNPNKGYVKGNVVAACHATNQFKAIVERENGLNHIQMRRVIDKCANLNVVGVKKASNTFSVKSKVSDVHWLMKNTAPIGSIKSFTGPKVNDLTGKVFDKYTVLGYYAPGKWVIKCTCGQQYVMKTGNVKTMLVDSKCEVCDK